MNRLTLDDEEMLVRSVMARIHRERGGKPFGVAAIQRTYHMGFNRAARLKEYALALGIVKVSEKEPYLLELVTKDLA